jgi:tRNA 2-selenouridine synthase SelU
MSKKISFFIKSLDEGYILEEENKTKAFENSKNVEEYILARVKNVIERFKHTAINNMLIQVEVQENYNSKSTIRTSPCHIG